jgi:3-oxoacyl-[acyl-carrier protein] reductase
MMGLTRGMAKELAQEDPRKHPGSRSHQHAHDAGHSQEWADAIIAGVPMGRMAEPDDIAKVAVFLASDDSGFVTGQNVAVNGGSAFL